MSAEQSAPNYEGMYGTHKNLVDKIAEVERDEDVLTGEVIDKGRFAELNPPVSGRGHVSTGESVAQVRSRINQLEEKRDANLWRSQEAVNADPNVIENARQEMDEDLAARPKTPEA